MKNKLLILVLLLFFGSLLFNTSCRTIEEIVYNLTGTWGFNLIVNSGGTDYVEITCIGGVATDSYGGTGTYSQVGNSFTITIPWLGPVCGSSTDIYYGTFSGVNTLTGTFSWLYTFCTDDGGTFSAFRL